MDDRFEQVIDRRGTASLKWDFAAQRGKPEGVLPMWVADMDHASPQCVIDALHARVDHGLFGYTDADGAYNATLTEWFRRRYDWQIDPAWNTITPGVVPALSLAVLAYTQPGDPVLIEEPVYYPFRGVVEQTGRRVISVPLVRDLDGTYRRDLAAVGRAIVENNVRLMILCNPHNPVGRVWTRAELEALAGITTLHDVVVVSDEIHADLTYPGFHTTPFASLSPEAERLTVTCTSPSKTFNTAGLQLANILIADPELRRAFRRALANFAYSQPPVLALTACQAAYADGDEWLDALREHLFDNRMYATERLESIEGITLVPQEGTYLLWLDCGGLIERLGIDARELDSFFVDAGLWFDDGGMFGESGYGYTRINIACPRVTLQEAFDRLEHALTRQEK